jgi:hypothetical protein
MGHRWTDHVPSNLELDFVHHKETTLLACRTDLLLSCTYWLVATGSEVVVDTDQLVQLLI